MIIGTGEENRSGNPCIGTTGPTFKLQVGIDDLGSTANRWRNAYSGGVAIGGGTGGAYTVGSGGNGKQGVLVIS